MESDVGEDELNSVERERAALCMLLRERGIDDERVLQAINEIPREEFVPRGHRKFAYHDAPLTIGHGQTISQPYTVAFMCELAQLSDDDKVLEVGTGSGYGAAVLSRLCREVHSVERIRALAKSAAQRLHRLGRDNVTVHIDDGSDGLVTEAPFDAIVVTAGGKELPQPLVEQLVDGGRIVIPLGGRPKSQTMFRFKRDGDELVTEDFGSFAFVPLIGEYGWKM